MLNGVGVVASKKRSINLSNAYDAYFPKPSYSDPILVHKGDNQMTIDKFIPEIVNKYSSDTVKISELLKKETIEATCKAIFDFVYKNIQLRNKFADQQEHGQTECKALIVIVIPQ